MFGHGHPSSPFSVCGQPGSPLLVCAGHIRSLLNSPNTPTCPSCVKPCPCPLLLFSVLGMFLFGGKFCIRPDGSGDCTCREILDPESGCLCERMHFNNFLWATVTVFQVSGEAGGVSFPLLWLVCRAPWSTLC